MRATDQLHAPAERIVDDPYARLFLSAPFRLGLRAGAPLTDAVLGVMPGLTNFVLVRHRFIDDALAAALADGVDQVVLLGAGYDTRLHRFADRMGSAVGFEVDHPATGARKAAIVAARRDVLPESRVVRVPVDFRTQSLRERLLETGFQPGRRTFWAWEGVSMYLERIAVTGTLETLVALSGPGSRLAMDFWFPPDAPTVRGTVWRLLPSLLHVLGEPITFAMHPDDVGAFLLARGLEVTDRADRTELARRYVRRPGAVLSSLYTVTARLV